MMEAAADTDTDREPNLIVIMCDELNPDFLGCAAHPLVRTPNIDRLAARGTRFTSAVTNSPICVPARASFASGRYAHETGYWDNATAYDGRVEGWGHRLQSAGVRVESIGKLHYRNAEDPTGFDRQIEPMHIADGTGQVWGSLRDPLPVLAGPQTMLRNTGPGVSGYNRYDQRIAQHAVDWLAQRAAEPATVRAGRRWVLFAGFVAPHFPLTVPREYFDLYPPEAIEKPRLHPDDGYRRHPWVQAMDDFFHIDREFDDALRRRALAAYMGLCTFLDDQVGRILDALDEQGLADTTRIIFTSDHGDNVGVRGLWGKCNMYRESVGVPLIAAGPGVPAGKVCHTPVSLIDLAHTLSASAGDAEGAPAGPHNGACVISLASQPDRPDRLVFSEYHAIGSVSGCFMISDAHYKYIHYVGMAPELFDLAEDPGETRDLGSDGSQSHIVARYRDALQAICDPEAVDRRAKADQAALIDRFGGREAVLKTIEVGADAVPGGTVE